jgi:hypothetical protein
MRVFASLLVASSILAPLAGGCAPQGDDTDALLSPGGKGDGQETALVVLTPYVPSTRVAIAPCEEGNFDFCEMSVTAKVRTDLERGFTNGLVDFLTRMAAYHPAGAPYTIAGLAIRCVDDQGRVYNEADGSHVELLTATITDVLADGRKVVTYSMPTVHWVNPRDMTCTATLVGRNAIDRFAYESLTVELSATWE